MPDLSPYRKAVVAVLTVVITALNLAVSGGLIPAVATPYVQLVISLAGAVGVYAIPNRPLDAEPGKHEAGDQ